MLTPAPLCQLRDKDTHNHFGIGFKAIISFIWTVAWHNVLDHEELFLERWYCMYFSWTTKNYWLQSRNWTDVTFNQTCCRYWNDFNYNINIIYKYNIFLEKKVEVYKAVHALWNYVSINDQIPLSHQCFWWWYTHCLGGQALKVQRHTIVIGSCSVFLCFLCYSCGSLQRDTSNTNTFHEIWPSGRGYSQIQQFWCIPFKPSSATNRANWYTCVQ